MPASIAESACLGSTLSRNGVLVIPARVIATLFTLVCFAGTIVVGLSNGNSWWSIMLNAFMVGTIALVIGILIGALFLRTINEHIERHREQNPIPSEHDEAGQGSDAVGGVNRAATG